MRELNLNKHWSEILIALTGALIITASFLIDFIGKGAEAGFGLKQMALAVFGTGLLLTAAAMLGAQRRGWDPGIPTVVELRTETLKHWRDILVIVILGAVVGSASFLAAQLVDPIIFSSDIAVEDIWFNADAGRVFANMTDKLSNHYRTNAHPLFSLMAFPPVFILRKGLSLEPATAVRVVIAGIGFLWIGVLFTILRLLGCYRFDAILFSLLGAISAAAMFWFVVPETYAFGSLSLLLALGLVALAQHRKLSPLWYVVVSALTLSVTLTNWMAGILAAGVSQPWKRALQITINAFCLVIVLWGLQKFIFQSAVFFIGDRQDLGYVLDSKAGGPINTVKVFVFHAIIMPAIGLVDGPAQAAMPWMSVQNSAIGSGGLWGIVASIIWVILLSLGLWGLFSVKQHLQFRLVLGLTLLGQLALHLVYGDEIFLYALHFGPLLVVLAALSTLTPARRLSLVLTGLLVLSAGVNNGLRFIEATTFLQSHIPPRNQVQRQMELRPADPWPRSTGHVVLATPGSREVDKAYHEPGGSFSPGVGSFGISLWLTDMAGNLETSSDNIPLSDVRQQLIWANGQVTPGILTQTSHYQGLWSLVEPGHWLLHLKTQANMKVKPMVVIRSVGPAGGPIESLDWDGQRLLINDRWTVTIDPAPAAVYLGQEGPQGWMTERSALTHWQGADGWGYARFEPGAGSDWNVVVKDAAAAPSAELSVAQTHSTLQLDLPDQRFAASLNAQVAHIMMGLVGRETRPGDPTNYPLAWQRDGAYVIVALACAGQLEVAKELSTYLAENDFYGGFGSEADAPGLAIWSLAQVAVRLNQSEYDQWLWPHIYRKAEFILKMQSTDQPIHQPVFGPIAPEVIKDPELTLVAEPAHDGLIIGRMDLHRPLLYVNAVSYRGLIEAASLADRVNQPADAARWRAKAAELKQAWEKAFKTLESENDRTYMSGLWPTWVAGSDMTPYLQGLQARWTERRDAQGGFRDTPKWTYFEIAEAHQWLLLNLPDRAWTTLDWFWNHQSSPGLYTWWEGNGEDKSSTFRRWEQVHGWVNPPYITPHYWTAAEMLLLQLDMLAYTDETASEPTVIIGAGIPAAWLAQPLKVQGLSLPNGQLDWDWDGEQMHVKIRGNNIKVRLGPAFSRDTLLQVEYLPIFAQ